ncbi:hypothetical protein LN042_27635 [Kitasatospora sp. RB6PN24]|uniref:hypothetical protein n=1 Tax=Kitasatospora humi TaxID=2893891 RepID=UPI001E291D7A|nr:hypothetical protein [Kitasatospora humi]MCC9310797.1 hypothetical protein [Kitasatospora humi]
MADNETSIALPEQTDEAEATLAGAVQTTAQAADQHIEPDEPTTDAAHRPTVTAPTSTEEPDLSSVGPKGAIISTH